MEAGDAVDGVVDRLDHRGRDARCGRREIRRRRPDLAGGDRRLVELAGESGERCVALDADRLEDRPHLLDIGAEVRFGARQQGVARAAAQAGELVEGDGSGHDRSFRRR